MIRHTLREWQRVPYGDADEMLPKWAAERLAAAARSVNLGGQGGDKIVSLEYKHLRAQQVVGILVARGCALEILPKIDDADDGETRKRLVHMLDVALDMQVDTAGLTELGWQHNDLLEILIRLFARKMREAVRRGMPRSYVSMENDLPMLRGRLDVVRQFTRYAAAPEKLACRFDELSPDIALNRIMKAAVSRLSQLSRRTESQRLLRELAFEYADISDVPVPSLRWDQIVLDRTNSRWKELVELARLLLGGRFQTTSMGASLGFSLLFEMNTLFEAYVARMLARAVRPLGLTSAAQGGGRYCLEDMASGRQTFQTRPDILIRRDGTTRLIIDIKWKRLTPQDQDFKQGVSQADIYQMIAYGQVYDCPKLMLLYPHVGDLGEEGILGHYQVPSTDKELMIASIDIGNPANMIGRLQSLVGSSGLEQAAA